MALLHHERGKVDGFYLSTAALIFNDFVQRYFYFFL